MSEPATPAHADRRADIDWLRVVCILILHAFHVGMFFVTWDWHVKNPQPLTALEGPMTVLHLTRMPLLMVIAGAGTAWALRRRGPAAFARDRLRRLGLPLLVGMFVIVPPQIYVERLFRGQFQGSYAAWYPSVFQLRIYPGGSFSWHHLWFVAYLLANCLVALPLIAWLRGDAGARLLARADAWLARGPRLLWLCLPLAAVRWLLRRFPETHALLNDPKLFAYFFLLFAWGHLLGRGVHIWDALARHRRRWLAAAVVLGVVVVPDWPHLEWLPRWAPVVLVQAFVWCVILAAFGCARAHVRVRRPWLRHAQELAYPFYILHQTVIVVAAFLLLRADPAQTLGPWTRYGLLLVATFLVTWALCELGARIGWVRPLLGLPPRPAGRGAAARVAAPAPVRA